jgi:HEAT repeat protein
MTRAASVLVLALGCVGAAAAAQEPASPQTYSAADLQSAIDKLGSLDYETRTAASRLVRRTTTAQAVAALQRAVAEHADGYVRYRALVLLTGFNDPRTKDVMLSVLQSPNDRLRTVAYSFFEHNPDRAMGDRLLSALDQERAEFVRPALVRALAAIADDPRIQQALTRDVGRGEDFFRSVVIEALGDYRARYAFAAIDAVARLDGPLQDDAALALGKIGDPRALETLANLQRTAAPERQPAIAAAICLLGTNCDVHEGYLSDALKFADTNPGYQPLLRGAAAGLAAIAVKGRSSAAETLFSIGGPSQDPTRAPVALAVGTVALRNTPLVISMLEKSDRRGADLDLLAEGFDMLEEDLEKERFFTLARRTYWSSAEGSPSRALMQTLITRLDF